MNPVILILICDFLLNSFLFSTNQPVISTGQTGRPVVTANAGAPGDSKPSIASLTQTIDMLKQQLERAKQEIAGLNQQIASNTKTIDDLKLQLDRKEKMLADLIVRLPAIASQSPKVDDAKEIQKLQHEVQMLNKELADARNNLAELEKRKREHEANLERKTKELNELHKKLSEMYDRIADIASRTPELMELIDQVARLTEQNKSLQDMLDLHESSMASNLQEIENLKKHIETLNKTIADLASGTPDIRVLSERNAILENENKNLQARIESIEELVRIKDKEINDARASQNNQISNLAIELAATRSTQNTIKTSTERYFNILNAARSLLLSARLKPTSWKKYIESEEQDIKETTALICASGSQVFYLFCPGSLFGDFSDSKEIASISMALRKDTVENPWSEQIEKFKLVKGGKNTRLGLLEISDKENEYFAMKLASGTINSVELNAIKISSKGLEHGSVKIKPRKQTSTTENNLYDLQKGTSFKIFNVEFDLPIGYQPQAGDFLFDPTTMDLVGVIDDSNTAFLFNGSLEIVDELDLKSSLIKEKIKQIQPSE